MATVDAGLGQRRATAEQRGTAAGRWQQPALLNDAPRMSSPSRKQVGGAEPQRRSQPGVERPSERLREVGLVGIAKARAALAAAARRADAAREAQQASRAA